MAHFGSGSLQGAFAEKHDGPCHLPQTSGTNVLELQFYTGVMELFSQMKANRRRNRAVQYREESEMQKMDTGMKFCIEGCLRCYQACLGGAMGHCLEIGGRHVEPAHFRLMMACAEICRTSAHFLLLQSEHSKHVCKECEEICIQCAAACEKLGDMQECVDACRACAQALHKVAA